MSFTGNNPKAKTLNLVPQSTDPANPQEGDLFRSDGTPRPEGVYEYRGSSWVSIGSSSSSGSSSSDKNYFNDPGFEEGVSNASLYNDSGAYVDGDGGDITTGASVSNVGNTGTIGTVNLFNSNSSGSTRAAQGFVATVSGTVDRIQIRAQNNNTDTLPTQLVYEFYDDNAGKPGTILESGQVPFSSFGTTLALFDFVLDNPVAVTSGQTYYFSFRVTNQLPGQNLDFEWENPGTYGPDFEFSTDSGATWTTQAYDLTFNVPITTGAGSPVITVTQNSTGPLAGTADLAFTKTSNDASGMGLTLLSTTIDNIDLGKNLNFTAAIDASSANYPAEDLKINVYDLTNSQTLTVIAGNNLSSSAGILQQQSTVSGTIETAANTAQIRLSLHCETDNATASSWTINVDELTLTPQDDTPQSSVQVFTSSGTWNKPAGLKYVVVEVVGGGGAGGGVPSSTSGQCAAATGGGGGGYAKRQIAASSLSSSETVTIGAGGTGVSGAGGNAGGTTSFGSLLSATGGNGGGFGDPTTGIRIGTGQAGGLGSLGDLNLNGSRGTSSQATGNAAGIAYALSGSGGNSIYGSGGAPVARTSGQERAGNDGTDYGGGGSGAVTGTVASVAITGGDGTDGIVIITEYY